MIDLARHIETLLVDNDCVIVPGIGGFITHYTSATWVEKDQFFLPPTRMTGFNSRLNVNDGLLVQSYMTANQVDFAKASELLEKDVDVLWRTLHTEGKAVLAGIGQLSLSMCNTLEFVPCTAQICTPAFYGLSTLNIRKLGEKVSVAKPVPLNPLPMEVEKEEQRFRWHIDASIISNAVAVVAIIILCFALSIPVENTEVIKGNYARLLPTDAFREMEKQSLAMTPLAVKEEKVKKTAGKKEATVEKEQTVNPVEDIKPVVKEKAVVTTVASRAIPAKTAKKPVSRTMPAKASQTAVSRIYHIIVASVGTEQDAQRMAQTLVTKGFTNAKAIIGDGKMRVCIDSYATEAEAYQALNRYRKNETYKNAWILKKK